MSFKSLMCSLKWLIQMLLQCFNKIYEQYLKESNVDALQEQPTDHQIWNQITTFTQIVMLNPWL
jgi:regulator of sigma D